MQNKIDILWMSKSKIKTFIRQNKQVIYLPTGLRKAVGIDNKQRLPLLVLGSGKETHLVICTGDDSYADKNGNNGFAVRHFDIASIHNNFSFVLPYKVRTTAGLTRWHSFVAYAIRSVDGSKRIILVRRESEEIISKKPKKTAQKDKIRSNDIAKGLKGRWGQKTEKTAHEPIDLLARKPDLVHRPGSKVYSVPVKTMFALKWSKGKELTLFKVTAADDTLRRIVIIASDQRTLNVELEEDEKIEEFCWASLTNGRQISVHRQMRSAFIDCGLPHGYVRSDKDEKRILVLTK